MASDPKHVPRPEALEPAPAQPDFDAMDDTAEYAQSQSREPLEGGLWLPLEERP